MILFHNFKSHLSAGKVNLMKELCISRLNTFKKFSAYPYLRFEEILIYFILLRYSQFVYIVFYKWDKVFYELDGTQTTQHRIQLL